MSYSGPDYGYDQISVNSDDLKDFLYTTNANRLHDISKIREREVRLLRKINQYKPTCQENRDRNTIDYCHPSIFSKAGSYIEQQRMDTRKNIEDHYYSGRQFRVRDCTDATKEGFSTNDMQYLQNELYELEQKNNMLTMFIFFLFIVVMIQYAKVSNDTRPMQVLMMPKEGKRD